jgi:hypothetical protein
MPRSIFNEIIIVDDRPSRGGGLPDFWEATIAKLVSVLNLNSNIQQVYIIGEKKFASKTIDKLTLLGKGENLDNELLENIVYKISSSSAYLRVALSIIKDNVFVFNSYSEMLEKYSEFINTNEKIKIAEEQKVRIGDVPFLAKELQLDRYSLTNEDGFRIDSLSEAFPLMLEIARKASRTRQITDQAGVYLGELIDFKVEFLSPLKNIIPNYYKKEEQEFEDYFQREFLNEDGLFAKNLKAQLPIVLAHIKEAILNKSHQYATRRAVLIIPNDITDGLAPLGLISVRIIPRFDDSHNVNLNYSFSWRTVEALVGFPYSCYGSIRYSDFLTKKIIEQVSSSQIEIKLDKVSYIAHSLHIFLDNFGQNIAKRIADDASI